MHNALQRIITYIKLQESCYGQFNLQKCIEMGESSDVDSLLDPDCTN
jgi:hypothetical protein